jgi:predicted RNA-binding Zn-ribbon protein involved in translation (DUF1610 family)
MELLRSVLKVFGVLKHRKPTMVCCPRCGDPEIHLSSSLEYGLAPRRYVCEKCGYVGPIVLELEKEED